MEKQSNNEISYLDVLVKRLNTEFVTTVFRKEFFTDIYLDFQTHCGRLNQDFVSSSIFDFFFGILYVLC